MTLFVFSCTALNWRRPNLDGDIVRHLDVSNTHFLFLSLYVSFFLSCFHQLWVFYFCFLSFYILFIYERRVCTKEQKDYTKWLGLRYYGLWADIRTIIKKTAAIEDFCFNAIFYIVRSRVFVCSLEYKHCKMKLNTSRKTCNNILRYLLLFRIEYHYRQLESKPNHIWFLAFSLILYNLSCYNVLYLCQWASNKITNSFTD